MQSLTPFGLRIPNDLKDSLAKKATQNRRSLNSEILRRLEESLKNDSRDTGISTAGAA